jgi:L-ascorbate metabolism protein UlaG (beta-lactamase superfamily)
VIGSVAVGFVLPALPVAIYLLGVLIGLVRIDAPPLARLGLALLWPVGPIAFVVTIAILLLASLIAFPIVGAIVLASALAAAAVFAQEAQPQLTARFIGNMAYAISDGRTTLVTDFPYESGYSIYMAYDPAEIRSSTPETIALITHRHNDHWDRRLFEKTGWLVVAPEDAIYAMPFTRVVRALPVAAVRTRFDVGPMTIDALPTPHANIGHYSYLVTWSGLRLYFTGDTDDAAQLVEMKDLDVAFVSPWLFERVQKSGRRIDARRIVIYHQTAKMKSVPGCADTCSVPAQGDTLRLR